MGHVHTHTHTRARVQTQELCQARRFAYTFLLSLLTPHKEMTWQRDALRETLALLSKMP